MLKQYRFAIFFILALLTNLAFGWSYTGHVIIAQIAYDNLTPLAKAKADQLATIIFQELPAKQQKNLDTKYSTASTFAKIAMLPDVWRKWKLGTILIRYHANVPTNFITDIGEVTQTWHFINLPYPADSRCDLVQPHNVIWAIKQTEQGLAQSVQLGQTNTQAVMMTLLEHYVGDSYQPLHVITRVDSECVGDKGGNDYCLSPPTGSSYCRKNLHALWDNAVGYIKPKMNIAQTAYRLEQRYPKTLFTQQLANDSPMAWTKANYGYANFIYSTSEYQKPSAAYYKQGQAMATTQMALAGYRLATILNHLMIN